MVRVSAVRGYKPTRVSCRGGLSHCRGPCAVRVLQEIVTLAMESCKVTLLKQHSVAQCTPGVSFGCSGAKQMWTTRGCRGSFSCGTRSKLMCEGEF